MSEDTLRWGIDNPPKPEQIECVNEKLRPKLINIANYFRYMDERVFDKTIHVEQIHASFELSRGKARDMIIVSIQDKMNMNIDITPRDIEIMQKVLGDNYEYQYADFTIRDEKLNMEITFMAKKLVDIGESEEDYKKRTDEEIRMVERATEQVSSDECVIVVN